MTKALQRLDGFVLTNLHVVPRCNTAIIRERIAPTGLLGGDDEWDVANRQTFGRTEKIHVRRIRRKAVHNWSAVKTDGTQPRTFRSDSRCKSAGARTNDREIDCVRHSYATGSCTPMI